MGMNYERERLKENFIKERGYRATFGDGLLALDPEFFQIT